MVEMWRHGSADGNAGSVWLQRSHQVGGRESRSGESGISGIPGSSDPSRLGRARPSSADAQQGADSVLASKSLFRAAGDVAAGRRRDRAAEKAKTPLDGRIDRGHGNMLARLAVTARLSGDAELAAVAKRYLLDISRNGHVDVDGDLERGHLMWGGSIAYDWLYDDLTEDERATVRAMLAREAEIHCQQTTVGRGYWRNQYLQNHGHVNIGGLAFAAAALYGEDPRAPQWLNSLTSSSLRPSAGPTLTARASRGSATACTPSSSACGTPNWPNRSMVSTTHTVRGLPTCLCTWCTARCPS